MIDDKELGGPAKTLTISVTRIGAVLILIVLCIALFGCNSSNCKYKYNKGDIVYLALNNQKVQVIKTYWCESNPKYTVNMIVSSQGIDVFKEKTVFQFELKESLSE